MTSDDLARLEARNKELAEAARQAAESLRAIEQAQRELQAEMERAKADQPVKLEVLELSNERLRLKLHTYRTDAIEILRQAPGRWYDSSKVENVIPIQSWPYALDRLGKLEHLEVAYNDGVREQIEAWVKAPHYIVDWSVEHDTFIVSIPKGDTFAVSRVSGCKVWRKEGKPFYLIPLIEAEALKKSLDAELTNRQYETEWTEIATAKVKEILDKRTELDSIALMPDAPDYDVDLGIGNRLRGFQRVGVKFADVAGGNVIIADQMGLGKTWQAVAYAKRQGFRTLVICKASLKVNWAREIIRLTGENPMILSGSVPGKWDIKELVLNQSPARWTIINYDIFGSKVEYAEEIKHDDGTISKAQQKTRFPWAELLSICKFDLVVMDEGHYIKNPDSNRSKASRAIGAPRFMALTGTPVLNRPGELWAMLTLIAPGKFPSYDSFLNSYTYDGRARNVEELRSILKSLMIRRLKKDVIRELPAKNRIYHYHELSSKAEKLYNRILEGIYEVMKELNPLAAGSEQLVTSILAKIMRLKQVCAIDKMDHTADVAVELNDSGEGANGKVIIYSQFKPVVYGIARRLGQEAVTLTGDIPNGPERMAVVDNFQNDPKTRFLVATWQVAGEGLNLTAAGYTIFNDLFWTPASHEQCEDRAYGRLDNPHPIDSYYIIADVKIEKWIQELLSRKLDVINETVEGMEVDRSQSIAKDLLQKMRDDLKGR